MISWIVSTGNGQPYLGLRGCSTAEKVSVEYRVTTPSPGLVARLKDLVDEFFVTVIIGEQLMLKIIFDQWGKSHTIFITALTDLSPRESRSDTGIE
jgi:hypothetical protein